MANKHWTKIRSDVVLSERMADLMDRNPLAYSLFMNAKAVCDHYGRLLASPRKFKGLVAPLTSFSPAEVAQAISDMTACGVARTYEVDGDAYMEISAYNDVEGTDWRNVGAPEYPAPPDWQAPQELIDFLNQFGDQKGVYPARYGCDPTDPRLQRDRAATAPRPQSDRDAESEAEAEAKAKAKANTHLAPAPAREATPTETGTQQELQSGGGDSGNQPEGETPDGNGQTAPPADDPPKREDPPRKALPPKPDHKALIAALEGAYPQQGVKFHRSALRMSLDWLTQPGCPLTEPQLAERLESDPPAAGLEPYFRHLSGEAVGERRQTAATVPRNVVPTGESLVAPEVFKPPPALSEEEQAGADEARARVAALMRDAARERAENAERAGQTPAEGNG